MTTSTTSTEPDGAARLLAGFSVAAAAAIVGLLLWAAAVLYTDRALAGFLNGGCLALFLLAATTAWAGRRHPLAGPGARVLSAATLVTLAYVSLPMPMVAAAAIILGCDALTAASGRQSDQRSWKATLETAGIAAFLSSQATALLLAPPGVAAGLDWGARLLLWAAAALALTGAAQTLARLLSQPSVRTAELDPVQEQDGDDKTADKAYRDPTFHSASS